MPFLGTVCTATYTSADKTCGHVKWAEGGVLLLLSLLFETLQQTIKKACEVHFTTDIKGIRSYVKSASGMN